MRKRNPAASSLRGVIPGLPSRKCQVKMSHRRFPRCGVVPFELKAFIQGTKAQLGRDGKRSHSLVKTTCEGFFRDGIFVRTQIRLLKVKPTDQPRKRKQLKALTVVYCLSRTRWMQCEARRRIVQSLFSDNFRNESSNSFISKGVKFALMMRSSMVHKETYATERGPRPQFVQLIL